MIKKQGLFLFALLIQYAASQDYPPIWSVTGGPLGIGSCYDIVTEQITFPAYEWHYDTMNTMDVRGTTYLIPDEVYGYSSPIQENDSRVYIMDSFTYYFNEYISGWSISAGVNIDGVTLNFAFSHTQGQINDILNNDVNYFAENVMTWSEFTMELWPGEAVLHPHFLAEVNKLPLQYDEQVYLTFVQNFGTHVINKAWYGAVINFTSVFHSDLVDQTSINWVINQVKLSIGWMQFNVGINWNDFDNTTYINDTFIENAQNVTIIQGGQPDVLEASGFAAWFQTVIQDYAVIFAKTEVQPLYEIIPNPTIAANLKRAIIAYGTGQLKPNHKIKVIEK